MRAIAWRGGLECESTAGPLAESAPPLIPANGLAFEVFEAGEKATGWRCCSTGFLSMR